MNTNTSAPQEYSKHVEANEFSKLPPAENPIGDSFNIVVSVPESIQIKMVDASSLADYEVWVFIASIISNAFVGFLVAYFQAVDAKSPSVSYVGWTTVVFSILLLVSLITALWKRNMLKKKGRDVKLKTSSASA
jgi:hypothetical protein